MSDSLIPTTTHHCSACGKPSSFRCSRCLGAQYCDVSCQLKDWKSHKELCKDAEKVKKAIEQFNGPQTTVEDVDEKIVEFRRGAELGNKTALYNLGLAYITGMGVAKDQVEATKLLKRSADLGFVEAQYSLGIAYFHGHGVEVDQAEAVKCWRKAAEAGHVSSQYNLGQALCLGKGVKKDDAESFKWFSEASNAGNSDSINC